jgi:hypothetical protein
MWRAGSGMSLHPPRRRRLRRFASWVFDGVTFSVVAVMSAVVVMTLLRQLDRRPPPTVGDDVLSRLDATEPRLGGYIRSREAPVALLFLDLDCRVCMRTWTTVAGWLDASEAPVDVVLVLDELDERDPMVSRIYEPAGHIRDVFGVRTVPTTLLVDYDAVVDVAEGATETIALLRSLHEAGTKGGGPIE